MINCMKQQRGITFLGFLIVLAVIGLVVFLGLRLYPIYYEKFQVMSAMKTVVNQPGAKDKTPKELRDLFIKNLTATTNINRFKNANIKKYMSVSKKTRSEPKMLVLVYELRSPFFDNIELVMNFDERLPLDGSGK